MFFLRKLLSLRIQHFGRAETCAVATRAAGHNLAGRACQAPSEKQGALGKNNICHFINRFLELRQIDLLDSEQETRRPSCKNYRARAFHMFGTNVRRPGSDWRARQLAEFWNSKLLLVTLPTLLSGRLLQKPLPTLKIRTSAPGLMNVHIDRKAANKKRCGEPNVFPQAPAALSVHPPGARIALQHWGPRPVRVKGGVAWAACICIDIPPEVWRIVVALKGSFHGSTTFTKVVAAVKDQELQLLVLELQKYCST